jgi:hypothetical protein
LLSWFGVQKKTGAREMLWFRSRAEIGNERSNRRAGPNCTAFVRAKENYRNAASALAGAAEGATGGGHRKAGVEPAKATDMNQLFTAEGVYQMWIELDIQHVQDTSHGLLFVDPLLLEPYEHVFTSGARDAAASLQGLPCGRKFGTEFAKITAEFERFAITFFDSRAVVKRNPLEGNAS